MKTRSLRTLVAAGLVLGLAGSARAGGPVQSTSPVDIDFYDYSMFCNAANAGTTTLQVVTKFYDLIGGLAFATPAVALSPGESTTHLAPAKKFVCYCQFVVKSGFPSDLRAGALILLNGRYLATSEAR